MDEWGVAGCVAFTLGIALVYVLVNRDRYSLSVAIIIVACTMFTYAVTLINYDTPTVWFESPPPWFVSRAVLTTISAIILVGIFRVGWRNMCIGRAAAVLALIALLVVPATLVSTAICLPKCEVFPYRITLIFAAILTGMLLLSLVLVGLESRLPETALGDRHAISSMLTLGAIVASVGFFEVAFDIGFVRNMFTAGVIETRASSTFHNPNWFAICMAPFLYTALALANRGAQTSAYTLMAFTTVGLLSAASRSVLTVMVVALIVFFVAGCLSRRVSLSELGRSLKTLVGGGLIGVTGAMGMAFLLGQTAVDRFITLMVRIVVWPFLIFNQTGEAQSVAAQSVIGRLDLTMHGGSFSTGSGVIDSAYLFMWIGNPLALVVLVAFFTSTGFLVLRLWSCRPDVTSNLNLSMFTFIVLVGFIGQVYWAFPVWIVLSVMFAWVLRDVVTSPTDRQHLL